MPEFLEALLVTETFVAIVVFIITWFVKEYLDNAFIMQVLRLVIKVADEHFESTEDDATVVRFIDKLLAALHESNLDTIKLESAILDEKEIRKK